jgi:glycine hydroxymethyltransferase
MKPSGIRLGTPAITTRGMRTKEIKLIATLINQAFINKDQPQQLKKIKSQVKQLCQQFPTN